MTKIDRLSVLRWAFKSEPHYGMGDLQLRCVPHRPARAARSPDWKARFEEADAKRQYWKTRCRRVENDLAQTRRVFRKLVGEG
jgi:hypothetical protein